MLEFLSDISLKEFLQVLVGLVVILSVIAEKSKKLPINPWSALFSWFGKCINKDLTDKVESLSQQTQSNTEAIENLDNKIDLKFEEKNKDDDEKEAKRLRASIIAFSDSCRINTKHTKQHFENVFRDIDDYNLYCMKHNIPNHYIDGEVSYITSIYEKCLRENSFL